MKKTLYITLCILLICALPLTVSAESAGTNEAFGMISVKFEEWVLPHLEEISVIATLILTAIYNVRKNKLLTRSMGTMNNNTVAIAQNSSDMMSQALVNMQNASGTVAAYDTRITALLESYEATAEDKKRLESELSEIKAYLKTASEANLEFSNELAELLNLANIPNFKKEEIGSRHLAAVNAIKAAENEVSAKKNEACIASERASKEALTSVKEVVNDVGEEA